jgi:3-dehydrosphinganine reductase
MMGYSELRQSIINRHYQSLFFARPTPLSAAFPIPTGAQLHFKKGNPGNKVRARKNLKSGFWGVARSTFISERCYTHNIPNQLSSRKTIKLILLLRARFVSIYFAIVRMIVTWSYPYLAGIVPAALFLLSLLFLYDRGPRKKIDLSNPETHVIVTGGSSGIGLATAKILRTKYGCTVTIISRDRQKLEDAKREIDSVSVGKNGSLQYFAADVSNKEEIAKAINDACAKVPGGRVDVLVMSAGVSRPGLIDVVDTSFFERAMKINYLGSIYSCLAVIPKMKEQRNGRLIYISSLAGLSGLIGFSSYTPTKYAIRGLAQCTQMELRPWGIYSVLVNPPDVDTPMLHEEMQWKPQETKIISEGGGFLTAEQIAAPVVKSINNWAFMVNPGFDGWLLGLMSADISTPVNSYFRAFAEVMLAGPLRLVGLVYLTMWNKVCTDCHKKRETDGVKKRRDFSISMVDVWCCRVCCGGGSRTMIRLIIIFGWFV